MIISDNFYITGLVKIGRRFFRSEISSRLGLGKITFFPKVRKGSMRKIQEEDQKAGASSRVQFKDVGKNTVRGRWFAKVWRTQCLENLPGAEVSFI